MRLVLLLVLFLSTYGFFLMGSDKQKAKKGKWRVNESTFFLLSFCGGAAGVWIGMKVFCHKTLHPSFRVGIPLLTVWNVIVLYYLLNNLM
ncbi:DUF1294 domain-containing protein [Paenactinomyces guangxiensis]|uniref:DUF1294 domain-containing protein n=1 Tax=Paenactinomyces guangxiensis TaxID=1490290 RepID=A0A7W1WNR0_9BACL|nr:DUF1294 domain-containing protein [Paenactinomyces guangxiensis]MBH8589866.1 DUF1294 domain-containing protein [Paenactinomyces guangxiensis]